MQTDYKNSSNKPGVYQIKNLVNNKIYIGSAKNFSTRFSQHIKSLQNNKHQNKHLQYAFNKDGSDNFLFEVLEVLEDSIKEYRFQIEQEYIDEYIKNNDWENCYNFNKKTIQKERFCFSKTPEETKRKISKASKKLWQNPEHIKYMSDTIKKIWEDSEYKENFIKKIKENYKNNPELKQKQSDHFKELWKNPEHRELIKLSREEFWSNPENVLKYSERMKNFKHSDETKENLRQINTGKELSKETKHKIKNSVEKLWEDKNYREMQTENKKGKIHSQETKDKLKIIIQGRKKTISNDMKNLWSNNEEYRQKIASKIKARCCKRIKCIDITTNQETIFESTAEAARVLEISTSNILDVLKNRIKLTNKKYKFEYIV